MLACPGKSMTTRALALGMVVASLVLSMTSEGLAQNPMEGPSLDANATGTFAPAGPPVEMPIRVDAGGSCVVDLKQLYDVTGSLSGSFEIDYRILVGGPCEVPPVLGKYEEHWIAHGTFSCTMNGGTASASLRYTAHVEAGGKVEGQMVLADGLSGGLTVRGNFADGKLEYSGRLKEERPSKR